MNEEGLQKDTVSKKQTQFIHSDIKGFRFFHDLSHLLKAEKKVGKGVSLQKVIVQVLDHEFHGWIKFGPLCNVYQILGCSIFHAAQC